MSGAISLIGTDAFAGYTYIRPIAQQVRDDVTFWWYLTNTDNRLWMGRGSEPWAGGDVILGLDLQEQEFMRGICQYTNTATYVRRAQFCYSDRYDAGLDGGLKVDAYHKPDDQTNLRVERIPTHGTMMAYNDMPLVSVAVWEEILEHAELNKDWWRPEAVRHSKLSLMRAG